MLEDQLRRALDRRREGGRLRVLRRYDVGHDAGPSGSSIKTGPAAAHLVDFSSNDYMGLSRSQELHEAFMSKMRDSSCSSLGSTGSRLLDGNTGEHEALEHRLAQYFRTPAALLFNSGFDANASLLGVLPQQGDFIIYDELVHASMHDGMRASRIASDHRIAFHHNDVSSLALKIKEALANEPSSSKTPTPNIFVAVESIYSMDGDACPLEQVCKVLDRLVPKSRRCLIVDEAHAVGLYGRHGAGLVDELGLSYSIDIRLATFGKAFGGSGAVVLCSDLVKQYLVNYARPLVYSTALPNVTLRLIDAGLDLLSSDIGARRAKSTFDLTEALVTSLGLQYQAGASSATSPRKAPIIPVHTARPRELAAHCIARGYLVRPIVYPTVPKGSERVRVCVHGSNTLDEVKGLAQCIAQWRQTASPTETSSLSTVRSTASSSIASNALLATSSAHSSKL